jgi:cell division protein FtsW (lipid II flippase)
VAIAIAGLALILILLYLRRPSRTIARGCLLFGMGILILASIDAVMTVVSRSWTDRWIDFTALALGAVPGLVLVLARAIARTSARPEAPARRHGLSDIAFEAARQHAPGNPPMPPTASGVDSERSDQIR